MKKPLALILAAALALSLTACGGKSSNLSIDGCEDKLLHLLNSDWNFTTTESNDGYTFHFSDEFYSTFPLTVEGTADKNQMVTQSVITFEGVPENYFQDTTALSIQEDIQDYMHVPMNRLATDFIIAAVAISTLDDSEEDMQAPPEDCLNLILSAKDSPQAKDGWTYTVALTEKTLTITSEYTG